MTSTVQIISLGVRRLCRRIYAISNGLEITSCSSSAEVLLTLLRAVKGWSSHTALVCGGAANCRFVCERMGPWYRRAVFIGDDLAVQSGPRSASPDGQSAMVALVCQRGQPHPLESIDEHEYSGYACRSKHFLFGLCLSGRWTALGSRWTHRLLDRVAQCVYV